MIETQSSNLQDPPEISELGENEQAALSLFTDQDAILIPTDALDFNFPILATFLNKKFWQKQIGDQILLVLIDREIRVPRPLIGLVIGRKGRNIKMLEQFLGHSIKIIKIWR